MTDSMSEHLDRDQELTKKNPGEKGTGPDGVDTPQAQPKTPAKPARPKSEPGQRELATLVRTRATAVLDPVEYKQMKNLALDAIKSEAVPAVYKNADQVLMALVAGREMGMKPMESLKAFYIVNGTLKIWGSAVPRRFREHGWQIKFLEEDDQHCKARITKGDETYEDEVKFEDAKKSGYTNDSRGGLKVGWREGMNRKKKLRYGVLALMADTYVPEVLKAVDGIVELAQEYDDQPSVRERTTEALHKRHKTVIDAPAKAVETEEDKKAKPAKA